MQIALVQCPCFVIRNPPLGLAYLTSVLREAGHEVKIFDFNLDVYPHHPDLWRDENGSRWLVTSFFMDGPELQRWVNQFADKILESKPDIIGFSIQTTSVFMSRRVARRIKERDKTKIIVFGGSECLREKPEFLLGDRMVDYVVQGEGEQTFPELLDALEKKKSLHACKGLIYMQDGAVVKNPSREPLDINALPLPDFSLFERQRYLYPDAFPMIASKGCIRRCKFCVDPWYLGKYRPRNPEHVVSEMEYLVSHYQARAIIFYDSLINGNLVFLERMCDLIIKRKIKIEWHAGAAVRDMSRQLLEKVSKSGCKSFTFGIESGSQKVIDLMQKGFRVSEASRIIRRTAQAGIGVNANWIVGFPGEDREDLVKSARFFLDHRAHLSGLGSICVMAIDFPSPISQETDRLGIAMEKPPFNWTYKDNTLAERLHRHVSFVKFANDLGKMYEADGSSGSAWPMQKRIRTYFAGKRVFREFLKELNNYH